MADEDDLEKRIEWFISNSKDICKTFGFDRLSIGQPDWDKEGKFYFFVEKDSKSHIVETAEELRALSEKLNPTPVTPNGPCICGSGKKFKKCCGRFI